MKAKELFKLEKFLNDQVKIFDQYIGDYEIRKANDVAPYELRLYNTNGDLGVSICLVTYSTLDDIHNRIIEYYGEMKFNEGYNHHVNEINNLLEVKA